MFTHAGQVDHRQIDNLQMSDLQIDDLQILEVDDIPGTDTRSRLSTDR